MFNVRFCIRTKIFMSIIKPNDLIKPVTSKIVSGLLRLHSFLRTRYCPGKFATSDSKIVC